MKATFVRTLANFNGDTRLFNVEPPAQYEEGKSTNHLVVSKVSGAWAHETYIFPADESGKVLDWMEMSGSAKGEHSHEEVLRAAGYALDDNSGAPGTAAYFSMRD